MLMSIYYDIDKIKYLNEIVELEVDIYNSDVFQCAIQVKQ